MHAWPFSASESQFDAQETHPSQGNNHAYKQLLSSTFYPPLASYPGPGLSTRLIRLQQNLLLEMVVIELSISPKSSPYLSPQSSPWVQSRVQVLHLTTCIYHSTTSYTAQLGYFLEHVRDQEVHMIAHSMYATGELSWKWTQFPKSVSNLVKLGVYNLHTSCLLLAHVHAQFVHLLHTFVGQRNFINNQTIELHNLM